MRFFDRFLTAQPLDPDPAGPAQPDQPARPAQPPPAPAPLLYVVPEPRPFEVGAELWAEVPPGVLAAALEGIPVFPIPSGSRWDETAGLAYS